MEGPTGGGLNENGEEDERMVAADAAGAAREIKSKSRYEAGVDAESLKVIKYFMDLFPQSVSGIGLMSENDLNTGTGSKREFCDIAGLKHTAEKEESDQGPAAKKVSKSSLILDLTQTAIQHHQENMAFNKISFEYMKESRKDDIARRSERENRDAEYRDKQDEIKNEHYTKEQRRLAENQKSNLNFQNSLTNILATLVNKF